MKVAIYTGKDVEVNLSILLLAKNIEKYFLDKGHSVVLADTISKCAKTDVVINLLIDWAGKIEGQRRYIGCGKQIIFFGSNVEEFEFTDMVGYLALLEKVSMVVHSKYHYNKVCEVLDVFKPSFKLALVKNLHLFYYGVEDLFYSSGKNIRDIWMLPFNRWHESQKQATKTVELLCKARVILKKHDDIVIRYNNKNSYGKAGFDKFSKSGDLEIVECPESREDYIEYCRTVGMFLSLSNYESFGIFYLELLLSGVVGIFKDAAWVRELLPEYKLIATSDADLVGLITSVYANYTKASTYIHKVVIPDLKKRFSLEGFHDRLLQLAVNKSVNRR